MALSLIGLTESPVLAPSEVGADGERPDTPPPLALSEEEKAPSKYRSAAAKQLEIFAKDDGTICTDRMADGARTGAGTETGGQTGGQTGDAGDGTSDAATGDKAAEPDGASATPPSGS